MSRYRAALRQERARRFGRNHPRLVVVLVGVGLAGFTALCAAQISHGTYLGRGWLIAAAAGFAAAAALSPAALIRGRHNSRDRLLLLWMVLTLLSVASFRLLFPVGHYGRPQAVINVVHAAMLGYLAATGAAIVVVMAWTLASYVRANGWRGLPYDREPPIPRRPRRPRWFRGWPAWVLTVAAAGLVVAVILAGIGGPNVHDAANRASGPLGALALLAVCVAGPAALYRWYRSGRAQAPVSSARHATTTARPAGQENHGWPDQAR